MKSNSKTLLILFVLILISYNKYQYTYFNIFLTLFLLIFLVIYIFIFNKKSFNEIQKSILGIVLLIIFSFTWVPDKNLFHIRNPDIIKWRKLEWTDFKAPPDNEYNYKAVASTGFSVRFNSCLLYTSPSPRD